MSEEKNYKTLLEHFEEPLFITSVVAFIVTLILPLFRGHTSTMVLIFIALLFLVSLYFIYLYFREGKKNYYFLGIPILIALAAFFAMKYYEMGGINARDYHIFSLMFGFSILFYSLFLHKILRLRFAVVFTLFISALLLHLAPAQTIHESGFAWTGKYLSALDPYLYHRNAKNIVNDGKILERENLNYPGDRTDFSRFKFFASVLMGSVTLILKPLGITVHDVAMIYPGVFAAFTVLVLYLLIRDLFEEHRPYNYLAAILAAFMLMLNPAFATKAVATNCEDDALGMFLLVSSFLLFVISFRRKSFLFSVLSGFSLLMLNLTWEGYTYAFVILGIFASLYSIVSFLHKRNCVEHLPYAMIPMFISQLHPLILHPVGELPVFSLPDPIILLPFAAPVFISFILEAVRTHLYGNDKIEIKETKFEYKVEKFIQGNIFPISAVVVILVLGVVFYLSFIKDSPVNILDYTISMIKGAKVREIIARTTAEQNPLCGEWNAGCLRKFYRTFAIASYFGFAMIPILGYFIIKRRSLGSVFVLAWALPMIWGVFNKSKYQFNASVPIVALGCTIGLILIMKRKDLESLRVVPTFLLITLPLLLPFIGQGIDNTPIFSIFGGRTTMLMGASSDRIYWNPTLQWIKTLPEDTVILTWWDYGHWIAAVSERTSILDNLKANKTMVQDIAKFHVLIEDEAEALEIARKYGATHVVIDWTMIGKSGAPHFIATSNLTAPFDDPKREGEYESYAQCGFSPRNSMLKPQLRPNSEGGIDSVREIVFGCTIGGPPEDYIGAIIFEIKNDRISEVKVTPIVKKEGGLVADNPVSWDAWRQSKGASILGVQSLRNILGNALNYQENPQQYINFATFNTLIYVPKKFNRYMMTALYLGDHMEEYREAGLVDPSVQKLPHFELVDGFLGDTNDKSYYGYVRVYDIKYPEDSTNAEDYPLLLTENSTIAGNSTGLDENI